MGKSRKRCDNDDGQHVPSVKQHNREIVAAKKQNMQHLIIINYSYFLSFYPNRKPQKEQCYQRMTVPQLKDLSWKRGIKNKRKSTKMEIIERLVEQ